MAGPPLQPLHVPAGLGIDEAVRPEHAVLGEANLSNRNARSVERLGLGKRLGLRPLPRAQIAYPFADVPSANRLLSLGGTPCVVSQAYVGPNAIHHTRAYSWAEGKEAWRDMGRAPECVPSFSGVPSFFNSTVEDVAYCNGHYCVISAAENASGVDDAVVTVIDAMTNKPVLPSTVLRSGTMRQAVVALSGRYFVAVYASGSNVNAHYFDTEDFTYGWQEIGGPLPSGAKVGNNLVGEHLAVEQLGDRVAVAYGVGSSGTSRISVKTFNLSGVVQSVTLTTANDQTQTVDVAGRDGDTLWVAWTSILGTDVRICGLDPANLSTVLASTATLPLLSDWDESGFYHLTVIPTTAGCCTVVAQDQDPKDQIVVQKVQTATGAAVVDGASRTVRNCIAAARGFYRNGRTYLQVWSGDGSVSAGTCAQQQIVLADITDPLPWVRPVCVHSFNTSTRSAYRKCKTVRGPDASKWYSAVNRQKTASSVSADVVEYDFAPEDGWEPAAFLGCTFLSGGLLAYLDGDAVYEAGFLFRPPPPTWSLTNGGTITTSQGGWRYVYVYEHIDSTGSLTQSGISDPSEATGNGNQYPTVRMAPLSVTMRMNGKASARIGLYRTTDGGKVFYRVNTVFFDGTAAEIQYNDFLPDSTLVTRAKLYRQPDSAGTNQDRRAPGPIRRLTEYNGFLVGAFGPILYWSGQPLDGEGAWFNPLFQSSPLDDEITGVRPLDGALVVYTRRSVYITSGEPPVDNASRGGLGDLRRISSDVGCTEPRSLVPTSLGHFFLSDRGVELLTRGQTVEFVGKQVQRTLAKHPRVTSAVLDVRNGLVRLTCDGDGEEGAVALVFDLALAKWISADSVPRPASSAAYVRTGGQWRYALADVGGTVRVEKDEGDPDAHLDGSDWVPLSWEPAHVRAGLQQQMRCHNGLLLVERHSAAGLRLEVEYGYEGGGAYGGGGPLHLKEWTPAETAEFPRQLPFRVDDQRPAFRMRVTDVEPEDPAGRGDGRGLTLVAASFDVVPIGNDTRGTPLLSDAARK